MYILLLALTYILTMYRMPSRLKQAVVNSIVGNSTNANPFFSFIYMDSTYEYIYGE